LKITMDPLNIQINTNSIMALESCFQKCVGGFDSKTLSANEGACIGNCIRGFSTAHNTVADHMSEYLRTLPREHQ